MTPRVVLLFAYHFPPDNAIGAARPFRFYKYLQRLGYTVHVITASPQDDRQPQDVEYVPDPFIAAPRGGFGWQWERAVRKLLLPGVLGIRWAYDASEAARRFLRANPGARTTIFSTFPPLGTHFAAWRLARTEDLPWIADFRDPLAGLSTKGLNAIQRVLFGRLERMIFESAGVVIANTDAMAQQWKRQYAREAVKIHLIWNGFDPEARLAPLPLPIREYKVLSHVGELYAGRTVAPLLESLDRLIEGGRISSSEVRVRLFGYAHSSSLPSPDFLERARTQGWLELGTNSIGQQEARQIALTAEFLLLVQPQSAIQVPGKLFEYLQIGRPILAFVKRDSPIERILSRSGVPYRCVYPEFSPREMDDAIAEFLSLQSDAVTASDWFQEQFSAERQTRALAELIESLNNGDANPG
jgi:glycosyltransferase involved in cell wall biosynthesis